MSAPTGIRPDYLRRPEYVPGATVPLESLAFPAAVVDHAAFVLAVNPAWRLAYKTAPGDSWRRWCGEAHTTALDMNAALTSAIQEILSGGKGPFVQDCSACPRSHRITVSLNPL